MSVAARVGRAWQRLEPDQRLAAVAALLLLASMVLPWYEVTASFSVDGRPETRSVTHSAFGVYSFVEAAILLVCLGVLGLLFARAERRAFHLPWGDGTVIMAAGLWAMFLIFYRQLDKPDIEQSGAVGTVGVAWGIFVAFLLGLLLAVAGYRIRASHLAEPPADDVAPSPPPGDGGHERPTARAPRRPPEGARQRSFDDAPTARAPADERPASVPWEEPPTRRARRRRDVFERPADPEGPAEYEPPRRRRH
jgi:hypothetical protein